MASLSQIERELIAERTRADFQAVGASRTRGGRKRQMTDSKVQAARKRFGRRHVATRGGKQLRLDVSVSTLYHWVTASSRT
jgi:DNA invertase Pin-like site-specific DNA recombinase